MNAYFEYLAQMLRDFFRDLVEFFRKGIVSPWTDVGNNFNKYHSNLTQHMSGFGFLGWFFFVLFLLFFIALVGAMIFGIFLLIRKYVRFVRKELDKDELRRQVERLNYELYTATQEKDKILNLKTAYMGLKPADQQAEAVLNEVNSRFPKLATVDATYRGRDTTILPKEDLSLEELCNSFRNYAASKLGLYYTIDIVRQVFAGMATSKLIILEGISGTGKTSLAYAMGKFFSYDSALIPVQPSWKDRSELLGYYNEFTKKFNESEFLKALYVATYRKDLDVIVLDEMNLARIEYYFAEFLSVMEMREKENWVIDLIPTADKNDPKNLVEGKLNIPQNIIFFGTANNDDSTFTISDKVYDRAISLFFEDKGRPFEAENQEPISIPYSQLEGLYADAKKQFQISEQMLQKFEDLDNFVIRKFKLAFGNRILKQLETFVPTYIACGGTETEAFDFMFANKILKKFESLNIAFLREELEELLAYLDKLYGKGKFPKSQEFIRTLLKNN